MLIAVAVLTLVGKEAKGIQFGTEDSATQPAAASGGGESRSSAPAT